MGKLSQYQSIPCRFKAVHWTVSNLIFIRPQTDHSLALSLSDSQTNKLTPVYCVVNLIGVPLTDEELEMPFQDLLMLLLMLRMMLMLRKTLTMADSFLKF